MFFGHFATNISYIIELWVSNIFKIIFLLKQEFFFKMHLDYYGSQPTIIS